MFTKIADYWFSLRQRLSGKNFISVPSRESYISHVKLKIESAGIKEGVRLSIIELSKEQPPHQRIGTIESWKRFDEFFDRFLVRYAELLQTEYELSVWDFVKDGRSVNEIQHEFVNRTEAFNQQAYAEVSAFIKMLSHINSPSKFERDMPSRSVSKFLTYTKSRIPELGDKVLVLEKATGEYRSKYIDHTSQNAVHDWSTSTFLNQSRIMYFTRSQNGKILPVPELSFGPVRATTNCPVTSYFVPPHHNDVLKAFIDLVREVLSYLQESRTAKK